MACVASVREVLYRGRIGLPPIPPSSFLRTINSGYRMNKFQICTNCFLLSIKMSRGHKATREIVKTNTRLAIRKLQDIEEAYFTKDERYAKLSKLINSHGVHSLQLQKELDDLRQDLDILGENLVSSEEQLFAQLKADGSWKAKLISYWWRWLRRRQY